MVGVQSPFIHAENNSSTDTCFFGEKCVEAKNNKLEKEIRKPNYTKLYVDVVPTMIIILISVLILSFLLIWLLE